MVFRFVVVLIFFSVGAFAQDNFIKHKISQGDNLSVIAKKYGVRVKDITDANPNAPKILKLNSVLLIPSKNKSVAQGKTKSEIKEPKSEAIVNNSGSHEVLAKETLWGISKKYNVSVDDLKKANPSLETEGLKIGQQIIIPSNAVVSVINSTTARETSKSDIMPSNEVEIAVEVQSKETKYAIAKRYGITVAELEKQNPSAKKKLRVGSILKIKTSKEKADAIEVLNSVKESNEIEPIKEENIQIADNTNVKTDSTLFRVGNHSELIEQLISNATENIGTRYRSGGITKAGFDCSGLMYCTFGNFDIKLPRSSIEQSRIGIKVASAEAQKGDLIFFKTNGRRHINHVGMVVENADGEIKFVHSSTHGGVIISSTREPYYQRSFSQVNRILE
ncbi:LysM peptidoglycan-binding domain-containing protein [Flavobacterium endoglycinae]|uniref:LysM peptidoglycan-binding domain-containing protein n=1 Tax=Flavobacterium endoglycinae TaxID=2816357 RepID=A0ABX7QH98_9FLAO|nr:C40 family peptidase [Flavobacterium endoglycinae]QSW90322.1 LysM peptidoglycan-binding domain-containing protein [Flavobacterium endoglycinae]